MYEFSLNQSFKSFEIIAIDDGSKRIIRSKYWMNTNNFLQILEFE